MQHVNFINISQTTIKPISDVCWQWCSEQAIIFQNKIEISNFSAIGVSLVALLIYQLSLDFEENIIESTDITKETLERWRHLLVFFSFIVLAGFLLYYTFLN